MKTQELPAYNALINNLDPKNYITTKALQDAVFVALSLSQPLLVTGEPGTGKTQLSHWIAYKYGLPKPLEFHAKTTSTASDMFYRYDALRRFQDSQLKDTEIDIKKYVSFEALGKAILLTRSTKKTRSIILIDEIDKAPRDLPNDVLMEIERMSFTVKETGKTYRADKNYRPIVVITSNSEKNLPDAFLRRCVYFHIVFPDKDHLIKIIQCRFKDTDNNPLVSD
ncbi:ATPase AAA, partial [Candidatus Magnetomorum sp. HK-1]